MTAATPARRGGWTPIPADHFEHGDPRRYSRGCRCKPCTEGTRRLNRRNRYLRETGRGLLRPATRAAAHVDTLRAAGMEDREILHSANICHDTLYRITRGDSTINIATEQRILAVRPAAQGPVRSCASVPDAGTVRRLRALIAAGWYATALARRLDKHPEYIQYIANGRGGGAVTLKLAESVRALYSQLANERPEDHGLAARWTNQARKYAAARDWRDPLWWEDWGGIDDPNAPETEPKPAGGAYANLYHRADEMEFLASCGMSIQDIAKRLSTPEDTVTEKKVTETLRKRRQAAERRAAKAGAELAEAA